MEIRQLRYFVSVVRHGSFIKASEKLHIAQPALSRQISALEGELAVKLLFRTARGVEVTEAGRKLQEMADEILQRLDNIKPVLTQIAEEPVGVVAVGLPPSLAYLFAPSLVASARERYPGLILKVTEGFSVFLAEWLELGRIDIALLSDLGKMPALESRYLVEDYMVLVGTSALMAGAHETIPLANINQYPLAITYGFEKIIAPWLEAQHIEISYEMELDSIPIIKEMIMRGLHCSILPFSMVYEEVSRGELVASKIVDPAIPRRVVSATNTRRPMSMTVRTVESLLEIELKKLPLWRPAT